ncbi:MAG: hypothetical protein L3J15_04495 [Devosiaceae bacterium]|nr:hypothetical protein [Devosiaceae bacterium]
MSQSKNPKDLMFNLFAIALVLIFSGIAVAYYIDSLEQSEAKPPSLNDNEILITKIISGQKLLIPATWFKYNEERQAEFVDYTELVFILPLIENSPNIEIQVTIAPERLNIPSAKLLDDVYLHQFLPDQINSPKGLIGKPLKTMVGNIEENVFYDPFSANPFVAKCMDKIVKETSMRCIRTVQISEQLSATYSFEYEALLGWRNFDMEAQNWLDKIAGI